jgi:hypothetical protein
VGPTVSGGLIDGGDGIDAFRGDFGDTIDLQAGTLAHRVNGTTIAISVINFENVLWNGGGSGQWSIHGTEGANILDARGSPFNMSDSAVRFYGRGGDDTLYGSDGIDILDGGAGNDVLAGDANNNILIGGSGIDTAVLRYAFATYSFSFLPDRIEVTGTSEPNANSLYGPGIEGINRLYGIERLQFTDGVINRADGAPLVDDIYYLANNHDVFAAGADADDHYAQFGWHEGRDPNALFSTLAYLGANRDVAAAKVNPLDHYLAYGAREGRDPSAAFDSEQYLARNPDVAASGVNPLQHYLEYGQAEGRAIYAAVGKQLIGDFDPEYYLLTNPDVAAAGVDPLKHYEEYGWHEGRDPNAYFDTSYYLANNADVAAAGIDPLAHYEMYGWRELRDPSASFDTSLYLAAAPDVAAAGVDPLSHYLTYGRLEGRTTHVDASATALDDWLI